MQSDGDADIFEVGFAPVKPPSFDYVVTLQAYVLMLEAIQRHGAYTEALAIVAGSAAEE